ncbi:MAG: A24 family peptidase C-terminal domain-containing protein [Thermoplasmatota archaeon]
MTLAIDLARLFTGVAVLSFGAFTDLKWRRAPNILWLVTGAIGLALLGLDALLDPAALVARRGFLIFALVFVFVVYVLYRVGLIWGGADAKAIMALAVLLPFPLALAPGVPLLAEMVQSGGLAPPAFLDAVADSLLAFLLIPFGLFVVNIVRGDIGVLAFLGTKRDVAALAEGYVWPMQRVEDGRVVSVWFPTRRPDDLETQQAEFEKLGVKRVWVTPKVPFLVPLLAGLILSFTVGDVLLALVRLSVKA